MILYYKLDENKKAIPGDISDFAYYFANEGLGNKQRIVGFDEFLGVTISTVFLCMNHSYDDLEPQIFETMIFFPDGVDDSYEEKYSTWSEAEEGHQKAIKWVRDGCK